MNRLEHRPGLCCLLIFVLALASQFLFVAAKGWPLPSLHDEFSYLLAADTFASGRLSNPSHPLAGHFETFHILQHPSYASKYQPLPALFLALGQLLGHPALGVFLVSSLSIAAVYWALRPLLSHLLCLFGAFLAWSQFAPYSFFSFSYMGGNVSALCACLLFGSSVRLLRRIPPRPRWAVLAALAVCGLALSRPYEGLLLSAAFGLLLSAFFLLLPLPQKWAWSQKVLLPASATLAVGFVFLLFYNHSVTGQPLKLPYSVYETGHSNTPLFVFGQPRQESLPDTPHLRSFEKEFTEAGYLREKNKTFLTRFGERFFLVIDSFIPLGFPLLLLLLLAATSSDRWTWFSFIFLLLFVAACSETVWFSRHYLGGLLPFLVYLSCVGLRQLLFFRLNGRAWGWFLARLSCLWLVLIQIFMISAAPSARARVESFAVHRSDIQQRLAAEPGDDLVLVRYGPDSSVHEEWVYNVADIERAPVVWAHSLGPARDARLLEHFSSRRVWLLQVDEKNSRLEELSSAGKSQPPATIP